MSHQLTFEGFPAQHHREAYTAPYPRVKSTISPSKWAEPILKMSVSTNSVTLYKDFSEFSTKRRLMERAASVGIKRTPCQGTMSKNVRTSMKRAINNLFLISRTKTCYNDNTGRYYTMKNNFITLTLSDAQAHSDHFIKQTLLKNFIDALRRSLPAISYVWKAEAQKNGNIHFHIITDHFIDKSVINYIWNKAQTRHGYTDKYFTTGKGRNPPSTETRKVKGHERSANYMCKYFAKDYSELSLFEACAKKAQLHNEAKSITSRSKLRKYVDEIEALIAVIDQHTRRKIKGKLWGCSDNLLCKPFSEIFEGLSNDDKDFVYSLRAVSESEYYTTFTFPTFGSFLNGLTSSLRTAIRFYYRLLVHRIPIPDIVYKTGMKYSYGLNSVNQSLI
jgi:hypothetical protein